MSEFKSFDEFWPHYLREHSRPETRALHIAGTTIAAGSLAAWLATAVVSIWGLRCWATVPRGWVISCMNITTQRPSKILCGHFVRIS